jgi:hypothetical protein
VLLLGAAVRVLFALWSLVAGALQGAADRVLLSECCLRFGAWLLVRCRVLLQSAVAGAVAVASFARVQGAGLLFIFPPCF